MAQNIFKGLGIALITPFKTDGTVDYQSLKKLVEFQIDNGADFLCILATTGEAPCLTQDEKNKITELVKEVNHGRVKILKYCGGNNTAAVVEEIKSTDWSGIDGILSICPYYNKPSQEGLYQHFKAIAQVSPLPIVHKLRQCLCQFIKYSIISALYLAVVNGNARIQLLSSHLFFTGYAQQ